MIMLEGIETTNTELPPEEVATQRAWLEEFACSQWDAQIERDAEAGKLDRLAAKALADHTAGRR